MIAGHPIYRQSMSSMSIGNKITTSLHIKHACEVRNAALSFCFSKAIQGQSTRGGRGREQELHLQKQQLRAGSGPLAVAVTGEGCAHANLHAVRQHGRANLWQLEEVVLEAGSFLDHRHAILEVLRLVRAVIPKEALRRAAPVSCHSGAIRAAIQIAQEEGLGRPRGFFPRTCDGHLVKTACRGQYAAQMEGHLIMHADWRLETAEFLHLNYRCQSLLLHPPFSRSLPRKTLGGLKQTLPSRMQNMELRGSSGLQFSVVYKCVGPALKQLHERVPLAAEMQVPRLLQFMGQLYLDMDSV